MSTVFDGGGNVPSALVRKPKRPPFSRRGEQAIQAFQEAALADGMPRTEVGDDIVYAAEARGRELERKSA